MNNLIALINALSAPISQQALTNVLRAMVGVQQEFTFDVTIPSAQVLTLFDTPFEIVEAQGPNTIIVPNFVVGELIFNTTPYATNGDVQIFNGGNRQVFTLPPDDGFLFANGNRIVEAVSALNQLITDNQYVRNSPLTVTVGNGNPTAGNGNPTAGDSDIRLIGTYKVINL